MKRSISYKLVVFKYQERLCSRYDECFFGDVKKDADRYLEEDGVTGVAILEMAAIKVPGTNKYKGNLIYYAPSQEFLDLTEKERLKCNSLVDLY